MQTALYVLLGLAGGAALAYMFLRGRKESNAGGAGLNLLLQQMNELTRLQFRLFVALIKWEFFYIIQGSGKNNSF